MSYSIFSVATALTLLIIVFSIYIVPHLQPKQPPDHREIKQDQFLPEFVRLSKSLVSALPGCVILPGDTEFRTATNEYWAQQENETVPACVVRPKDAGQLATAVGILHQEYNEKKSHLGSEGLFAVRSGGHSPVAGAASIRGGIVLDLSLFNEVTPVEDGSSVVIGSGAKWEDVSSVLDSRCLAVAGGKSSAVGVGGLTLGGGLSWFSPRYGLVCNNIISYEVVLASGSIVTASETNNSDLWRALKGGGNNFGIVTCFTARSFPCDKIWSGFLFMPSSQAQKTLAAFHDFVSKADPRTSTSYDEYACGPMACFSYIQGLRMQLVAVNLVYTKQIDAKEKWPACWKESGFPALWRFWSTCKTRTLTSATDENKSMNPSGRRQMMATTTIKNDPATIMAAHRAYENGISPLRQAKVRGLVWTMVVQPILPAWVGKGDPNPLGLDKDISEPLVIVEFNINWDDAGDDELVKTTTRKTIEEIDASANIQGTSHPYRYMNYCAEWQKPFEGYGKENLDFLKNVSHKYDPHGLFQKGCVGGFKLDS